MRFRKGSKVEVLCKNESPSSSWRFAEILSGNGRSYFVRYDCTHEIDSVSRKAIRPCPPLVLVEDIAAGDVVEIFENFSWKMAKILKGFGGNHFLVRLFGSSLEFIVRRDNIRTRQSWKNNEWVVIGKDFRSEGRDYDESLAVERLQANIRSPSRRKRLRISLNIKTGRVHLKSKMDFDDSSTSTQKTSSVDVQDIRAEKALKKNGVRKIPEKPDTSALPRKMVYEKYIHSGRTTGYSDDNARFCSAENQESTEAESTGSCSIVENYFDGISQRGSMGSFDSIDDYSSNSESLKEEEDAEAEIHRLELDAYRSTIVAFHALGPLSWEKEALISNLRRCLNISDDEHLMEIRNLLSSGNQTNLMIVPLEGPWKPLEYFSPLRGDKMVGFCLSIWSICILTSMVSVSASV